MISTKSSAFAGTLLILAYWFHLLRNVTVLYYLAVAILLLLVLFVAAQTRSTWRLDKIIIPIFLSGLWVTLMSIFQSDGQGNFFIGEIRFWASFPLIVTAMILSVGPSPKIFRLFVGFYILAAISFPIQYSLGAIDWFAEASERAGSDRFASLTGSLTSYGSSVGVAVIAARIYLSPRWSLAAIAILAVGAVLSLQKSAIANIFISIALSLWVAPKVELSRTAQTVFVSLTILLIISWLGFVFLPAALIHDLVDVSNRSIEGILSGQADLSGDVDFVTSLKDRLYELPFAAFAHYGWTAILFGSGVFGASGALGYPDLPMAHNGVVELLLIFGIPLGVLINIYLSYGLYRLGKFSLIKKNKASTEIKFLFSAYLLITYNNLFSGGAYFQPISASIFWLVFFRARYLRIF